MQRKKRIGILTVGLVVNWLLTWGFEFILYPIVIYSLGMFLGGFVMMVLSFFLCYGIIIFYDWSKKDWIGIETIKQIKTSIPNSLIGKIFHHIVKRGDTLALIFLSIKFDPFITVIYMRHGAHQYNGLSKRDWKIFIISLIIGDLYWTLAAYTGITIIQALWHFILRITS